MIRTKNGAMGIAAALAIVLGGAVLAAAAPHGKIASNLRALPGVNMFADAFESTGAVALLEADQVYTVFAPTDASIERASLTFAEADDVLAWVIPGIFTEAELIDMVGEAGEVLVLETVAGTEMTLALRQANELLINDVAVVSLAGVARTSTALHVVELEAALEGVGGSD